MPEPREALLEGALPAVGRRKQAWRGAGGPLRGRPLGGAERV